jgi:assimilatory nitrate reductase catalytic subunit
LCQCIGLTDPISGQPELKAARVSLTRFPASWYAFGVFENFAKSPDLAYWARMRAVAGWRIELADERADVDFEQLFWNMFGTSKGQLGVLEYADPERGAYRIAAVRGRRLTAALFVSREPVSVLRNWACAQLGRDLTDAQQQTLLAGYPARGAESTGGHVVCTCHDVGSGAIQAAIFGGKRNLADVGHATAAGTNCGSCRGEIQRMIAASELRAAV